MAEKACFRVICVAAMCIMGCFSPYSGSGGSETGLPGKETPVIQSTLFKEQVAEIPGVVRFYTNDPKYRTAAGYTLWTYSSGEQEFVERKVEVRKTMGSSIAGYGVIIRSANREVDGEVRQVFLTVMINNNKQYAVGKVVGGEYKAVVDWTNSKGLKEGLGLWAELKVVKGTENGYELYCNGVYERTFVDEEAPICEGKGRNGYIVVIGPEELVTSGVEVWYKE